MAKRDRDLYGDFYGSLEGLEYTLTFCDVFFWFCQRLLGIVYGLWELILLMHTYIYTNEISKEVGDHYVIRGGVLHTWLLLKEHSMIVYTNFNTKFMNYS